MLTAALIVTLLGSQAAETSAEPVPFMNEVDGWLLSGEPLPDDFRQRLLTMDPTQRVQALIYLRRTGLLTGRGWSVEDMLRPATPPGVSE